MRYLNLVIEHLYISFSALIISLILSILLVFIAQKNKKLKQLFLGLTTLTYTIPSLAMFALLIPFTGLGKLSVIISLALYVQYILVRSFITLLNNFDKGLLLASKAMGLNEKDIFFRIKLPLLKSHIISSIKISLSTIISIANIGAIVNAGGIGVLIFSGLRTMNIHKIALAIFLNALVYLIFNLGIYICVSLLEKIHRKFY